MVEKSPTYGYTLYPVTQTILKKEPKRVYAAVTLANRHHVDLAGILSSVRCVLVVVVVVVVEMLWRRDAVTEMLWRRCCGGDRLAQRKAVVVSLVSPGPACQRTSHQEVERRINMGVC